MVLHVLDARRDPADVWLRLRLLPAARACALGVADDDGRGAARGRGVHVGGAGGGLARHRGVVWCGE